LPHSAWRIFAASKKSTHRVPAINVQRASLMRVAEHLQHSGNHVREAAAHAGVGLREHLRGLEAFRFAGDNVAHVGSDGAAGVGDRYSRRSRLARLPSGRAGSVAESDHGSAEFRWGISIGISRRPFRVDAVAQTMAAGASYSRVVIECCLRTRDDFKTSRFSRRRAFCEIDVLSITNFRGAALKVMATS